MTTANKPEAHVEALIKKAAEAGDSGDAQRFSQAAANSANALCALLAAQLKLETKNV